MAVILIIEDETAMAAGLKDNLEFEGHEVIIADNGALGMRLAMDRRPDLILLDIMLPGISGFDVCREIRAAGLTMPVIMLTARGEEIDKVLGLEIGADDYITKPFSVRELLARIKAVMRRTGTGESAVTPVRFGRLQVDLTRYTAHEGAGPVELTHKEFEIIRYFHRHAQTTVSRDDLIEQVWGYDAFPSTRTVDNHILKLRKKIEPDPAHPRHILTVHGIGYKFIP
ncbi:response regulator transcription factor [bacterium]|nr:response regulator transcription factor [bacterium]